VTRRKNYFPPNHFAEKLVSISADQWLKISYQRTQEISRKAPSRKENINLLSIILPKRFVILGSRPLYSCFYSGAALVQLVFAE
jgi:hypothetical protein